MIRIVTTAIALMIATTASADACGFFAKLKYNGQCSEAEFLESKKSKHLASGETFAIDGNYAFTTVGEDVVVVKKSELIQAYKRGGENAIIDLIGDKAVENFSKGMADEMWGKEVGKDLQGNILDEKSISDFRDGLKDIDTSALSTSDIVSIINQEVVTVLHEGSLMTFATSDEANAYFGAEDPEVVNQ